MDMLHARIDDVALGATPQDPLGRLHGLFARVQESMPSQVAKWRCRGLAHLCRNLTKSAAKGAADAGPTTSKKEEVGFVETSNFVTFPPRFRDIPCKPLLFDLAFPSIEAPDIASIITRKGAGEGQQKGLLGRISGISGNLGSR